MTSTNPPDPNVNTFNNEYWNVGETTLTQEQADKRYLRFPIAQGTENLAAINVNGNANFNNPIEMTGSLANRIIDMNNGEIHQCSLVHSQVNNDITIESKGTGSVILETAATPRFTLDVGGNISLQGGLQYTLVTNAITNATWSGNVTSTDTATNATFYPTFVQSENSEPLRIDKTANPLTYNPSTSTLTSTNFNGTASTATNANNVLVTSDNTSGTYYIPFVKTSGTGNKALFMDDATGPLTYNPSTQILSLGANAVGSGGQYFVRGLTGEVQLRIVGDGGATSRELQFVSKATAGVYNPSVATDDTLIFGSSGAGAGTSVLRLTSFSNNNVSVRLSGNAVLIGAGGTSSTATTSINCDGSAGNIVMNTNSTARLTINQTGEVVYNYWDCGNPFLFDDFTSFLQLSGPFGWFPNVSTLGAGRAVYSGALDATQSLNLPRRLGLLSFSTGANNNSDNFLCSGERIIRPASVRSITWGGVDCGTGTLASLSTPSATNVTKSFGLYNTTTPNSDDSDLGGIIWRRSSANASATAWQFYVNNVLVTNGTGPATADCSYFRITIEFQLSGGNYQTRGIFTNLGPNNAGAFTSDWVNVPTNPTVGDSALVLGNHLRNNGDASARVIAIDYCLLQNNCFGINRGNTSAFSR